VIDGGWNGCPAKDRDRIMNYFTTFLSNASNSSSNVLMSSEAFAKEGINVTMLKDYLQDFDVEVVVFYRRFYDWILSFYNQLFKMGNKDARQPFVEWLETNGTIDRMEVMHTAAVYQRFNTHFEVSVLNMHRNATLILPTFFCENIKHTNHSCHEAIRNPTMPRSNPSTSLDSRHFWNEITIRYSSMNFKRKHRDIAQNINDKFNAMGDSIPRRCLSEGMKRNLLDLSIQIEKSVTPPEWHNSDQGIQSLTTDFHEKAMSKLCSVDAKAMLDSEDWQKLFANEIGIDDNKS